WRTVHRASTWPWRMTILFSPIRLTGSATVSPGSEESSLLLLVQPAEKFLKSRISLDFLDRIECVPQLVMRPRFVDEIFAGMAGRNDIGTALTARNDMVPSRRHVPLIKCAFH